MNSQTIEQEKGRLACIGIHKLYEYWKCLDCGTEFPRIGFAIKCNGHTITKCPWCRNDSAPWTHGRGL